MCELVRGVCVRMCWQGGAREPEGQEQKEGQGGPRREETSKGNVAGAIPGSTKLCVCVCVYVAVVVVSLRGEC